MGIRQVFLYALTVLLLCACGGEELTAPEPGGEAQLVIANRTAGLTADAAWQKLIDSQQAGAGEFDQRQITVVYRNPGTLQSFTPRGAVLEQTAAGMPNATLRTNKQYEAISDAIAADNGLNLRQQVYRGECNLASFDIPEGVNAQQILQHIRQAYTGQVAYALFSPLREKQYTPNDPDYALGWLGPLWDRWQVHCGVGWDYTLGSSSVLIAVVDTGVRISHEELSAQVINPVTQFPSSNCDVVNNDKTVEDYDGHGTFIAGIIAAQADNNRTIVGVAPHCRVLPIKISNDGYSTSPDLIAGCYLAADLGARVVNLSFGNYDQVPVEKTMVDELTADGVLLVSAAGNDGLYNATYPAAYPSALCVGSTDFYDYCTTFSNWGTAVDMAAPGIDMKSCSHLSDTGYETGGEGTSFSAPMVAAAAGLLWSYDPTLTLADVRDALEHHGYPAWDFATIIRRLDLPAAFGAIVEPITPTASGLNIAEGKVWGSVAGKPSLAVQLTGAKNVAIATYTLDLVPLGDNLGEDLEQEGTTSPSFAVQFDVSAIPNQPATLHVAYKSITNTEGTPIASTQYIFNQRGDANCDGVVDIADHAGYGVLVGLTQGQMGYLPFYDSDLDGVITEADASAVGYFYNGVWPGAEVVSITPLTGSTGQQVTFHADVTGNEPIIYAWDFGGGASPNTSTAVAPSVTLGALGKYSALLTLSNAFGHTTYPFTLEVGERQPPTAIFTADPTKGPPPLAVGFDASASTADSGAIVNYQWSWDGDTTWEEESASPLTAHTFSDYGIYEVLLRVTDEEGLTGDTTRTIKVADVPTFENWEEYELGPWGSGSTDDGIRLAHAIVANRNAVAWNEYVNSDDTTLHLALAKNTSPVSLDDWYVYSQEITALHYPMSITDCNGRFALAYITTNALYYTEWDGMSLTETHIADFSYRSSNFVALAAIAGKPAMIFTAKLVGDENTKVHYAYATTTQPASLSDWVVTYVENTGYKIATPYNNNVQLCDIDSKPMLVSLGTSTQTNVPLFIYADSAQPLPSDWHGFAFPGRSVFDSPLYLFSNATTPALAWNSTDLGLTYSKSQVVFPTSPANWNDHGFAVDNGVFNAGAVVDGFPVILASVRVSGSAERAFLIAASPEPVDTSAWELFVLPQSIYYGNRRIINHNGYPALLAIGDGVSPGTQLLYRYPY